ncbi:MAG: nicotinic acid mononucleotide adenylyltransferase, partial [Candidatus Omnitrophota bacterium]
VEGVSKFEVSDIEVKAKTKSYSIDTVKKLKDLYGPECEIYFIAGSDYAGELDTWREIDALKKLCSFVIAARPGYKLERSPEDTRFIEVDTPDISSTEIRERVRDGKEFKELVPEKVYGYIKEKRLYSQS